MSTARLVPLFEYKTDETIPIQDKDQKKPTALSIDQYNAKFNTQFCHGLFCEEQQAKVFSKLIDKAGEKKPHAKLEQFLQNPNKYSFTVRYISEACGYGLVANSKIPAGTVIGIYSGQAHAVPVGTQKPWINHTYDMMLHRKTTIDSVNYNFIINASVHSDLTRFAVHMPASIEGATFESSIDSTKVKTANVDFDKILHNGVPLQVYTTNKTIEAGDIIAIDYGYKYWMARGVTPDLFLEEKDEVRILKFQQKQARYEKSEETVKLDVKKDQPAAGYRPHVNRTRQYSSSHRATRSETAFAAGMFLRRKNKLPNSSSEASASEVRPML